MLLSPERFSFSGGSELDSLSAAEQPQHDWWQRAASEWRR